MVVFKRVYWKNFLSTGSGGSEVNLNSANTTLIVGKNGHGKCFCVDTVIKLRNVLTGEILETTVGEFYNTQNQNSQS